MDDALLAQFQKARLEEHDDRDRIEPETDDELEEEQEQTGIIPELLRNEGPQTGPKGVKADHDYYQKIQQNSKAREIAAYNARVLAKAPMTTTYAEDKRQEGLLILEHKNDDDDNDDEVIKMYRQKRLNELRNMKANNHLLRQQQKVFGHVNDVNVDEYLKAIDNEWKTVPVIVHIYDKRIPACNKLDEYLIDLAKKYALAKFIRIHATEIDFDLVGSPAILAYQGGILIANLVRIIDEVGQRFDVESIEDILQRHGALSENDIYEKIPEDNDDDDDDYDDDM
ncbi:hypothetical protein RMATCC62417_08519 [Rhizopus microsporus]|nr:hypothetical protein RMATCC62417_08519 [Rhizopus microsporus]